MVVCFPSLAILAPVILGALWTTRLLTKCMHLYACACYMVVSRPLNIAASSDNERDGVAVRYLGPCFGSFLKLMPFSQFQLLSCEVAVHSTATS
eukprot:2298236-Pleurochrysis_carterae.AAC.1